MKSFRYHFSSFARQPLHWVLVILVPVLTLALYLLSGVGRVTAVSGTASFFSTVSLVCLVVLPALSIRALTPSVEFESTFPVSPLENILGETLALVSFYLISLAGTLPLLIFVSNVTVIEPASCLTSYLILLLYGVAVIAFCSWISRLFSNTVFSYLITVSLLILLNTVHLLPVDAAWIKNVSFIWHFDSASKGILATKDLLFFLASAVFCICGSLESSRYRKNRQNRRPLVFLALEFCLFLLVSANATVFNLRWDTTSGHRFSLSDESKAIVSQVEEPLRITWYVSKTVLNRYPQADDIESLLRQYPEVNRNISVTLVSDAEQLASANLGQLGIAPQTISTTGSEETRTLQVYSAIVLEMGESIATVPFILSHNSLEYDVTFRIRSMLSGAAPVVAILNGTGLDLDTWYSYLQPWITSSGMIPAEITADQLSSLSSLFPESVLLVLGSESFTSEEVQAIDAWVSSGKPAFFAVSQTSIDITGNWTASGLTKNQLLQLLDFYGSAVDTRLVYDDVCYTLNMYRSGNQQQAEQIPYHFWPVADTAFTGLVHFFWPGSLTLYDTEVMTVQPVARASQTARLLTLPVDTNPFNQESVTGLTSASSADDGPVLAALLEGKLFSFYTGSYSPKNRVMVVADQYFLSNLVENTGSAQNFSFLISSLLYLNGDEDLLKIKSRWEY